MILTIVTIAFNIFLFCISLFGLIKDASKTERFAGIMLMVNLALNSYMVLRIFKIMVNA